MKRVKFLLTCLVIILSLLLSTSCSFGCTLPSIGDSAPALPSIAEVVAKVKPSVVAINTKYTGYDFFGHPITQEGAGSGWIIRKDGIIVTNNHVVEGAGDISVTLDDGRTFPANTVYTDPLTDLAVVKINAKNLPAATMGDSSRLKVGDWVTAIGNSLGLGIGATTGIVSGLEISIPVSEGQTLYDLIQTDAAINPGNSGGPLVNMAGEVIGITSVKISQVGVEGMGYAISSNVAMPIIEELVKTGYVVRPWLGVEGLLTVDSSVAFYFRLSVDRGILIRGVTLNSPADEAGLEAGDVIVAFADKEMTDVEELRRAIHASQIGDEVKIAFWRGDSQSTTYATLAESPPPS